MRPTQDSSPPGAPRGRPSELFDAASSLAHLRSPLAIRARCENVLSAGLDGALTHFAVNLDALPTAAAFVADLTRSRFPTLRVPVHGRMAHFRAGGVDRVAELNRALPTGRGEQARAWFDLVVVSVLLDAGAGDAWTFTDGSYRGGRSEGLAVASLRAFAGGLFSTDGATRVDAGALATLAPDRLASAMQVRPDNPLVGFAGRAELLTRVGRALSKRADVFIGGRPSGILDSCARNGRVVMPELFRQLLDGFEDVWPSQHRMAGRPLGDVWVHPFAGGSGLSAGFVPFHKLTQWLCYSLVEPMEAAGLAVDQVGALTGLPEYRNGGLLIDTGVLVPKHAGVLGGKHAAGDEIIVEWRALTVSLLDRLADMVRERLGKGAADMPLGAILEGGTWAAGRALARQRRADGGSPIAVTLDGTVF